MGFGGNRTGKQEIPMSAELTMDKPYRNFINGVWESSQSARDVIDPANNRPFASFYEAGVRLHRRNGHSTTANGGRIRRFAPRPSSDLPI
jgi:hypothetical protein